jgi:nitrogen fixation/metabolism regulation signal transduction histidine kinase
LSAWAALLGALIAVTTWLLLTSELYATAVVSAGLTIFPLLGLSRAIRTSDRSLAIFVDCLAAGEIQNVTTMSGSLSGFAKLGQSLDNAVRALNASRTALRREIDRLQSLTDTISIALIILEPSGRLVLVNRAALKLAGRLICSLQELPGLSTDDVEQVQALSPGGRLVLRLASGQRLLVSASHFKVDDESCVLLAIENIDNELGRAELKAWQDLVRVLGHEMMNSMTPIVSLARSVHPMVAELPHRSEDIAAGLDAIARRSQGLMRFVDRYRAFAEVPAPVTQDILLISFIGRLDHLMRGLLGEKGIALKISVEPSDLTLSADPDLLEQALINLIKNASDAVLGFEDPQIEIVCYTVDEMIGIQVVDNGSGVSHAVRDQIFVPFYSTKPDGAGVGLSLVRQIVLLHGGRIEFSDNQPSGSMFSLLLPRSQ